ncbi:UNVERIFIED_CONTAM: hypothetical protein Sindi_0916800 [Sesamum indicum]
MGNKLALIKFHGDDGEGSAGDEDDVEDGQREGDDISGDRKVKRCKKTEKSRLEDEGSPVKSNDLTAGYDEIEVADVGDGMAMGKDENLDGNDGVLVRRAKLGFGGAPSTVINGEQNLEGAGAFNMAEFIRLANTVIDAGDKEATTVLCKLKKKWEKCFGKESTTRCFPARSTTFDLPMAGRKAWRSLRPPAADLMLTPFCGENGGRKDAQTTDSGQEDDFWRTADVTSRSDDVSPAFADNTDDVSPASDDVTADFNPTVTSPVDVIPAMTSPADTCNEIIRDMRKTPFCMNDIPTPTGLFVSKIPLHTYSNPVVEDKIADAFNNSSRKTLLYIAPIIQNGEMIVRPTMDVIRRGSFFFVKVSLIE